MLVTGLEMCRMCQEQIKKRLIKKVGIEIPSTAKIHVRCNYLSNSSSCTLLYIDTELVLENDDAVPWNFCFTISINPFEFCAIYIEGITGHLQIVPKYAY